MPIAQPCVTYLVPAPVAEAALTRESKSPGTGRPGSDPLRGLILTPSTYEWNPSTLGDGPSRRGGSPVLGSVGPVATPYPLLGAGGGGAGGPGAAGGGGSGRSILVDAFRPSTLMAGPSGEGFGPARFPSGPFPEDGPAAPGRVAGAFGDLVPGPDPGTPTIAGPAASPAPSGPSSVVPEPPALVSTLVGLAALAVAGGVRLARLERRGPRPKINDGRAIAEDM